MTQDQQKRAVAQSAVDYVLPKLKKDSVIGIGTGSTANYFIDLLAQHKDAFRGTVASSAASAERLQQLHVPVFDLNSLKSLDFYIDGADEATSGLALVKGGGAALTQEKIVAAVAKCFVCIADSSKWVDRLGAFPLPVEVIPMARALVVRELAKLGGRAVHRADVVTDNHCHILDVHELQINDPAMLERQINQIPGVVTNGLFAVRGADVLLMGTDSGVQTRLALS